MVCLFRTVFRMLWFAFVQYLGCSGLPFLYNAGSCGLPFCTRISWFVFFVQYLGCCGLPFCKLFRMFLVCLYAILRMFWFAFFIQCRMLGFAFCTILGCCGLPFCKILRIFWLAFLYSI